MGNANLSIGHVIIVGAYQFKSNHLLRLQCPEKKTTLDGVFMVVCSLWVLFSYQYYHYYNLLNHSSIRSRQCLPPLVCVPNWGLSSNRGHYQPGSVPDWWVCIQINVPVDLLTFSHIHTLSISDTQYTFSHWPKKISKFFQLTRGNSRSRNSSSTSVKTGDITQPGSVPYWWVCIQTNVAVGSCLQTHLVLVLYVNAL